LSLAQKIIAFGKKYHDLRMGVAGSVVMAVIVFIINFSPNADGQGALTAALKQAAYTFIFAGFVMRGCELLAIRIKRPVIAIPTAVLIPSAVSILLTFGVHSLKGTPHPFASTLPTALFVIPATAVWGYRKRKKLRLMGTPPKSKAKLSPNPEA
jgi:hypothetical protein